MGEKPAKTISAGKPHGARVLLVEDSETQALRLRHYLEQQGLIVAYAPTAEAALEHLNRELPDLLITDYHLPGIAGDELCRQIRMNVNTRGMPILLLTSEDGQAVESRALDSGADDFVRKSDDHEMLLLRIQVLLRKSHVQEVLATRGARFGSAKLLIVDDSATYRKFLESALAQEGYRITTAGSGEQALACLAMEPFDAVILDLILPDIGGAEVCRRLTESRRTLESSFLILALTGRESKEDMSTVLEAGADDVIGKSRDIELIKTRLRALLRRKMLYEENRRIAGEFQERERQLLQERADRLVAQAKAALVSELERANRDLEAANRELKETQSQLVQAAKMASLGQLVAGIAHEINNPLAFVMNHAITAERALDAIAKEMEPTLSPETGRTLGKARERLADLQGGLERIKDLVLQLRTFSRLDEGEVKHVKIEESIESVITMLRHRLKDRIRLKRDYGDVKVIPCYPGPLNQVLMNVISNAIDAIEGEGEIAISTGRDDSMLRISVKDTGRGMSEEIRDRIFEPFFTTKPVGQGTGLGLSISYGIIQRHRGTLEVRSVPGRGTEMVLRIPLDAGAAGAKQGEAPPETNVIRQERDNGQGAQEIRDPAGGMEP
jgi:two-component system, NtrC family, sensor kinase